jgi:hypothetical protein
MAFLVSNSSLTILIVCLICLVKKKSTQSNMFLTDQPWKRLVSRSPAGVAVRSRRGIGWLILFLLVLCLGAENFNVAFAQSDAIEQAGGFPWYDAKDGSVKQVRLSRDPNVVAENRDSDWEPSVSQSSTTTNPNMRGRGLGTMGGGGSGAMTALFWVFVGLMLLVVVGLLVWAFLRREELLTASNKQDLNEAPHRTDAERIEQLPVKIGAKTHDMLSEARSQFELGNYQQAMVLLFSHMLLTLDRNQWIRLTRGKTNRQYWNEVRRNPGLIEFFQPAMFAFEDVFFGQQALSRDRFEQVWNRMSDFQKTAEESTPQSMGAQA